MRVHPSLTAWCIRALGSKLFASRPRWKRCPRRLTTNRITSAGPVIFHHIPCQSFCTFNEVRNRISGWLNLIIWRVSASWFEPEMIEHLLMASSMTVEQTIQFLLSMSSCNYIVCIVFLEKLVCSSGRSRVRETICPNIYKYILLGSALRFLGAASFVWYLTRYIIKPS